MHNYTVQLFVLVSHIVLYMLIYMHASLVNDVILF